MPLGVGVAAVNTGNNLLYLALSLNLSLILLSGVLSEGTLRRISLRVRPASEAFAGAEAFLAVTCSAEAKRFPGISLVVALRTGEDPVTVRFPDIAPGTSETRVVPFRPRRRGGLDSIQATVSTRFPFSLFEKSVEFSVPAGILVSPRPSPPAARNEDLPDAAPSGRPFRAGRVGAFPRGARGEGGGRGGPGPGSPFGWGRPAPKRRSRRGFRKPAGRCSTSNGGPCRSGSGSAAGCPRTRTIPAGGRKPSRPWPPRVPTRAPPPRAACRHDPPASRPGVAGG